MSRIKELKRQLEAVSEAIEALDADVAAGRLDAEAHARQRAEREREAGRLFVSLRIAQREALGRRAPQRVATAEPRAGWLRRPLAMAWPASPKPMKQRRGALVARIAIPLGASGR